MTSNLQINTKTPQFVHLRLTSEYSFIEGILRSETALELAENDKMPALAITDVGNMFGAVKFAKKALKKDLSHPEKRTYNIQPIIGTQLWVRSQKFAQRTRVIALSQNATGYKNLCRLVSNTYTQSTSADSASLILENLQPLDLEGLCILSGHLDGDIGGLLLADQFVKAKALAQVWQNLIGENYFLELQLASRAGEDAVNEGNIAIAEDLQIATVATHPIMFATPADFDAHEIRYCIANNEIFSNSSRPRPFTAAQYFTTSAEMIEKFVAYPQAIKNSVAIAQSCSFLFDFLLDSIAGKKPTYHMPTFESANVIDVNKSDFFRISCNKGLKEKLIKLFPDENLRAEKTIEYQARLDYEVNTIIEMGFADYYLVVQDFINWAKNSGIPVGPGRGSGAGSIAAYVLHITDIDPISNGLLFERFLNKERVSMPDFDIDFCEARRQEVINYVRQKYGVERVANIITYMTMAARASIKDCGRALGVALGAVTSLTELIPNVIGITLEKAFKDEPQIAKKLEDEPALQEVWKMALKLEDLPRNSGVHAAGILITPQPLSEYCPLYRDSSDPDEPSAAQYDMKDIEALGLVKFDFLGLATLTVINNAVKNIHQTSDINFNIEKIPEGDVGAYSIFQQGQTNAIFQCESRVCKDLERRIHIENFEEITALMALNRPGPLNSGMVENYINVKHQKEQIKIFDERIAEVLKPTYGVIIYQEQVMQIAQILAKYSLGEADILRRAMGKKDEKLMAKNRDKFVERAKDNATNPKIAEELFNLIEKFAEYGFNKSHSAAYGLIAYQTAYLKAHHPAEYMAAVMTNEIGKSNVKIAQTIQECQDLGITVTFPSINECDFHFYAKDRQNVVFGLGAIKGLGQGAIENIVAIRNNYNNGGLFKSFDDFLARVDRTIVNKRAMEGLIKAGAFDVFDDITNSQNINTKGPGIYRQYYLDYILKSGDNDQNANNNLFGDDEVNTAQTPEDNKYSKRQNVIWENEVLEFSWSGHLIDFYKKDLKALNIPTLAEIASRKVNDEYYTWCAGIITFARTRKTNNGTMMNILLEDGTGITLDLAVFNKLLQKNIGEVAIRNYLKEGSLIIVYGLVQKEKELNENMNNDSPRMRAEDIINFDIALKKAYSLTIPLNIKVAENTNILPPPVKEFLNTPNEQSANKQNEAVANLLFKINVEQAQSNINAVYGNGIKVAITEMKLITLREKLGDDFGDLYFTPLPTPEVEKRWRPQERD